MKELYNRYLVLTTEQRKLLCFLAYTGSTTDTRAFTAYTRHEGMTRDKMLKTLLSLRDYLKNGYYYSYHYEYALEAVHQGPLLVYMLCENPVWLRSFEQKYKSLQASYVKEMLPMLRTCIMGLPLTQFSVTTTNESIISAMVPLACYQVFLPWLCTMLVYKIGGFVSRVLVYQAENDITDPDDTISQLARRYYGLMSDSQRTETHCLIALYDYYQRGRYDAEAAAQGNLYGYILCGLHALYAGDYDTAFKQLTLAIRESNREADSYEKGFFQMVLNNYVLVMAFHFKESDQHKKLGALMKKNNFADKQAFFCPARLGTYLTEGKILSKTSLGSHLKNIQKKEQLYAYLALLTGKFFGLDVAVPEGTPPVPKLRLLRHELSPWLKLTDEERLQLEKDFGGKPLISRIRYKQPWELLLKELTPKEAGADSDREERTVRVSYLVNYDRVEVREQSRLKSGAWGAGKRMSLDTFHRGTDFMDDADRKIASKVRNWYSYDIDVKCILPHLIGSDRVYTGRYAPFQPVTIEEEKPYLIIERGKNAFSVKSNIGNVKIDGETIFRKDGDTHYTVIPLTEKQRIYYKKLLAIGSFPLEAEQQLREFLPKVSDVVEAHTDLVEGGSTLQHRNGQPQLCLQVLPTPGTRNQFSVYCLAHPLNEGKSYFTPGKGLNPCVAEADGERFQVTRDIKGERANLQLLTTFLDDNNVLDDAISEPFADRTSIIIDAEYLLLLMQFAKEQQEHFYMEWPEGGQLNLKTANPSAWNIGLKSKNGWFEVEGEIPIDDDTVITAAQLLELVASSQQKGFIRLGENDYMAITDKLRKQLSRLESLTTSNRGHLQISELHASLLGSALSGEIEIKHDKSIDELQGKIKKSMALKPAVPKQLKADLRDYQQDGYLWMNRMTDWGAGVCLADDMGLGKTVQTIAFLLKTQTGGAALVAAPASVVLNWRRELERFAPSLNVIVLNSAPDRQAAIKETGKGDVMLTTYGLFVTEAEHLLQKEWNTVCLDEAHVIKNRETKTSQAVMQLKAKNRIILTGTPVQNHLGELWNLYQFINPGLLGSYDQFSQKYIVPIEQQDNKERSKQLKRIIQPFILRRTKQEVIEELPDKTEITMPVELSDDELAVYEVIRRRAKELLEEETTSSPSVNTLAEITRLRQAACAAQLAEKKWKGDCSKINVLLQLVAEITDGGNSVLVFSQFTSFLSLVRKALEKVGQDYLYLDGAVTMKKREQMVQDFQHGRCPVFLISLKAGGLGLNLTGANYVIHLDPWWNPAIEQQATDRAYRIGQSQNVTVYHLISQHTIEEKILRLHETKRNLADAMLEGTSQSHKLTSKDLLKMIEV